MPDQNTGPVICQRNTKGFTLVELMVILIIVGAITALAIPQFTRSITISRERRALNNLHLIHSAEITYQKNNNVYWPPGGAVQNLAAINTNLFLNVLADGDTYTCRFKPPPGSGYDCRAAFDNAAYELRVTEAAIADGVNPCCSSGACPITPAC